MLARRTTAVRRTCNVLCPHRLASLKEVIIPGREKEDQAGFLVSAAAYIRQLQV